MSTTLETRYVERDLTPGDVFYFTTASLFGAFWQATAIDGENVTIRNLTDETETHTVTWDDLEADGACYIEGPRFFTEPHP